MIDPELERTWNAADANVAAPRGFDERLFARLEREAPVRAAVPMREAMPWWVRAAGERHVALAFVIAGIILFSPTWWLHASGPACAAAGNLALGFLGPWLTPLAQAFALPRVELAVALAFAPLLGWGAYLLARSIERATMRAAFRLRA
jgi:hypothetical protein